VESLLTEFRAAVETAWRQLEDDDQRVRFQAEVFATFQWARAMTLTSRAQARQKLVQINRHAAYLRSPRERGTIQMDA
jgi:hypothetical protein